MRNDPIRAVVWSTGSTWHYAVYYGVVVVLYDNTGNREIIMATAISRVRALRHLSSTQLLYLNPYDGYFPYPRALYDQTRAVRRREPQKTKPLTKTRWLGFAFAV